jgi:hypothetical protein
MTVPGFAMYAALASTQALGNKARSMTSAGLTCAQTCIDRLYLRAPYPLKLNQLGALIVLLA